MQVEAIKHAREDMTAHHLVDVRATVEFDLNKAERLVQAETMWAMLNPKQFPAAAFHEAWRQVLLYSEHTWGAAAGHSSAPISSRTKRGRSPSFPISTRPIRSGRARP
jgi:hypothetical protein